MDSRARQAAFERQFVGYLLAVTGAAVAALLVLFASVYLSARDFSFARLWEGASLIALTFLVFWTFAFLSASIPAFITIKIAQRFSITNAVYFLICGALSGIAVAPFFPTWYTAPAETGSLSDYLFFLRHSVPAGFGGGLYWWKVVRRSD